MRLRTGRALTIAAFVVAAMPALATNPETNVPASGSVSGKTLNERLIEAARDGRADEVGALIHDGAKVDARDDSLWTPLILAASTGQVEIVKALLKAGADVNATNSVGSTALMLAARAGDATVVRLLLDAKSPVNAKGYMGMTALHYAAHEEKVDVMELLLAAGADISAQSEVDTPLDVAAYWGHVDAVRRLLRHGCPVNVRSKEGIAPLDSAIMGENASTNVIRMLLDAGANINAQGGDGHTALICAAQLQTRAEVLEFLIQSHADLNKTDNQGWTALMLARQSGQDEAVKVLKAAGAQERTNLSYAAAVGDLATLQLLLAKQDVNRPKQKELDDAVYMAVQNHHADVVKELLAHGANPNARMYGDWTAFVLACREGDVKIARQLLVAGADVNLPRSYNGDTPLMQAAAYMPAEFVNEIIAKGAQVNVMTRDGDTAAGWAAFGGKLENLKVLVEHGAEINTRVGKLVGWPGRPLGAAVSGGHVSMVDFLVAHGGDVNTTDNHGKSLLMYAVANNQVDVAKLLIARGANVLAQADYDCNNTALKLAENTGKLEITALLRIMEFPGGGPKDSHPWSAKLVRALTESTRTQIDNRPPDNAGLLAVTKEIAVAPDTTQAMKADARYLAAMADLETLRALGLVSNATARAALEADIADLQKNHPDDVRTTSVQQQWAALQQHWAGMREAHAQAPLDLKFTAVDGTDVDVAKLRGKVMLVDFWATWCGPCRMEIPKVVAAYNELHKNGFEIIGISLDENRERLTNFTKQAGMTWPQYFDGKSWENVISSRYGIQSIPTMWLVDKKGFVRLTEIEGDNLAAQVKKLLAE